MSEQKPPPPSRARKAMTAFGGDDEFSVYSVDEDARKEAHKVDLAQNSEVQAESTPAANSVVRLFRKIFGE